MGVGRHCEDTAEQTSMESQARSERLRLGNEPDHRDQIDRSLFSLGGPFDHYPFPALVVGRNNIVLAANRFAEPLVKLLHESGSPELEEAIETGLAGQPAQINPLLIAADDRQPTTSSAFDLLVLPWANSLAVLLLGREITVERSLRAALVDSRQRFKDLVEISSDLAWETDREGRFTFVSTGEALGYSTEELIGRRSADFLVGEWDPQDSPFVTEHHVTNVQVWFEEPTGETTCLAVSAVPLEGQDGAWAGARGLCRDITAVQRREQELSSARARERLLAYILRNVRDELEPRAAVKSVLAILVREFSLEGSALYSTDQDGLFVELARHGEELAAVYLAVSFRELQESDEAVHEADASNRRQVLLPTRHRAEVNGALCLYCESDAPGWAKSDHSLLTEVALHLGAMISRIDRQEALQKLSNTDPLTGLLNRRGFMESLEESRRLSLAAGKPMALFFIDLDNFKQVNDSHGHQTGDHLLKELACRLQEQVRDRDLLARLGGDEFGLLVEDMAAEQATRKGEALIALKDDLKSFLGDDSIAVGLSVGVEILDPDKPFDRDALLARADAAMYQAKRHGKGALALADSVKQDSEQ